MNKIDLHIHTTCSDGSYSPLEIMKKAKAEGIWLISVTDHDTLSGYEECCREARRFEVQYIPGIEMSAQFDPGTLHILGYFVNPGNGELQRKIQEVQQARLDRNPQIIEKLNFHGVEITLKEVQAVAYGSAGGGQEGQQLGRPHFAETLLRKGYVKTYQEAFEKFLAKGKIAYVDKRRLTSEEIIQAIHQAGGVAVVAHPKLMRLGEIALEEALEKMVGEGLDGLEVYSSCHGASDVASYQKLAKRFGLIQTGGSDFHGTKKPNVRLGDIGKGFELQEDIYETLRAKSKM
ncbi:MAG: PHP domain-containing protein [Candidatus Omnitrophica bacterium]|nr:PHP domain-containing protein [Candidatus Omnitrophota bacterium]